MSEQNKSVVRRIIDEHWNKKNPALIPELFATTVALHTPDGAAQGQDGAQQLYMAYATAFPDFRIKVDDMLADGNRVAVRYTFVGTHLGPLASIPATGKPVNVQGMVFFRLAGSKADEVRFVWDKFALMEQLGVLPQATQAGSSVPQRS